MCKELAYILSIAIGGEELYWRYLIEDAEEYDIDLGVAISRVKDNYGTLEFNALYYELLDMHADDVKKEIEVFLNEIEDKWWAYFVDEEKLQDYDVAIFTDYADSHYDEKYSFWGEPTHKVLEWDYEVARFLIDNDIVELDEKEVLDYLRSVDDTKEELEYEDKVEFLAEKIREYGG